MNKQQEPGRLGGLAAIARSGEKGGRPDVYTVTWGDSLCNGGEVNQLDRLAAIALARCLVGKDEDGVVVFFMRKRDGQVVYLNPNGNHALRGKYWTSSTAPVPAAMSPAREALAKAAQAALGAEARVKSAEAREAQEKTQEAQATAREAREAAAREARKAWKEAAAAAREARKRLITKNDDQ